MQIMTKYSKLKSNLDSLELISQNFFFEIFNFGSAQDSECKKT